MPDPGSSDPGSSDPQPRWRTHSQAHKQGAVGREAVSRGLSVSRASFHPSSRSVVRAGSPDKVGFEMGFRVHIGVHKAGRVLWVVGRLEGGWCLGASGSGILFLKFEPRRERQTEGQMGKGSS